MLQKKLKIKKYKQTNEQTKTNGKTKSNAETKIQLENVIREILKRLWSLKKKSQCNEREMTGKCNE